MDADAGLDPIEALLAHPHPEVRELAERVLQAVDALHRPGVERLAALLDHHGLLAQASADPTVAELFDLYELLPVSDEQVVERALEAVRPYIQSHGGQLEVLAVAAGVVTVRLAGSCAGCSGSALTLKRGVESALVDGYPGFVAMVVEEAQAAPSPARPTFIGLGQIERITPPLKPIFEDAAALEEVVGMVVVEVGGEAVLLHNLDGEIYAFRRDGARRDSFPVAVEDGRVKVAVNVPARAPLPA